MKNIFNKLSITKYQLIFVIVIILISGFCLLFPVQSHINLWSFNHSIFITVLGTIASIITLFCSLSMAWILFVSQENKNVRINAYYSLKSRLFEAQKWLLEQPNSEKRSICLSNIIELQKFQLSDLPQQYLDDYFKPVAEIMERGLNSDDEDFRHFSFIFGTQFMYIEELFSRIEIVGIQQIIAGIFINTLAKGIGLIAISVLTLIASTLWYNHFMKPILILIMVFCGISAALLIFETWVHINKWYSDELEFIEK